jgi:tetratricopeptide (TPR) repeat protein
MKERMMNSRFWTDACRGAPTKLAPNCWRCLIIAVAILLLAWPLAGFPDAPFARSRAEPPGREALNECTAEIRRILAQDEADETRVDSLRKTGQLTEAATLEAEAHDRWLRMKASWQLFKDAGSAAQDAIRAHAQGDDDRAATLAESSIVAAEKLRREGISPCRRQGSEVLKLGLKLRAVLAQAKSQWSMAQRYQQRVLDLAREEKRTDWEAEALVGLANSDDALGESQSALKLLSQAEQIQFRAGNDFERLRVLHTQGNIYQSLGRYSEARRTVEESRKLAEKLLQQPEELTDRQRAFVCEQHLELLTSLIVEAIAEPTATCQANLKEIRELLAAAKADADVLDKPRLTKSVKDMEALIEGGLNRDYGKALELLERGWTIYQSRERRPGEIALTELDVASLGELSYFAAAAGQVDKARAYGQQALDLARPLSSPIAKENALTSFGHALYLVGDHNEAEKLIREALSIWTELQAQFPMGSPERAALSMNFFDSYEILQAIALARQDVRGALRVAEEMRGSPLAAPGAPTAQAAPSRAGSFDPIGVARAADATLVVYGLLPDFHDFVLPSKLEGTQSGVDKTLLVWVVDPSGSIGFRQVDIAQLIPELRRDTCGSVKTLGAYISDLQDIPSTASAQGPGFSERLGHWLGLTTPAVGLQAIPHKEVYQALYRLLVEPIADLLPTDPERTIVFLPTGPLYRVPFAGLTDSAGHRLIERHSIALAPSLAVLQELVERPRTGAAKSTPDALVVGIENFSDKTKLPNAPVEARVVAKLLRAEPLLDSQATRDTVLFRLPRAPMVHFATHGSYSHRDDSNSLILAADQTLSAADIGKLQLGADLVALDACRSGSGRITAEGVFGLARAFLNAGARSALVSVWDVWDVQIGERAPAPLFAGAFYRAYADTGDKARAVRQAMLAVSKQYPDPRAWAGFTLVGAPH